MHWSINMISSLKGQITVKEAESIVLEIGGVGLQVFIPAQHLDTMKVGQSLNLQTHLVVREDSLTIYGFETREEREFFILLLGVNGVGPRLALSILSTMDPNAIRRAVFNEQIELFNRVPGVGKKTAQKILIHLQDKVKAVDGFEPIAEMEDADTEILEALTALGYSIVEAQAAVQTIPKDAPDDIEARLRLALQYFITPS
jgi:Holliday junction DNA helicase RuvA